ncbi:MULTISPECIES: hypothetical protein [Agrobacterium]|uniref:Uncharacterized protein n=1 Tax=Agrobacterium larrymoorei TaxID=160699 RepID=A0ABU0UPY2_9HYPH|nr:hypothetical protein [Agrobacterium larrymoorei]MDQ1186999.1 hypothetical protein [Agrobacterium larrymoorei]MDQ1196683.1 hypothetical protein [Rhizobium sp. SORGH_AS_0787]
MDRLLKRTLLAACLLYMPFGANAAPVEWGNFGNWSVAVEPDRNFGCYVALRSKGDTILHFGMDLATEFPRFYLLLRNEKWKSLEDEKVYPLLFTFDSKKPLEVEAIASVSETSQDLAIGKLGGKFIVEAQKSSQLRITYADKEVANLPLEGAATAFYEMRACQDKTEETLRKSRDEAKQQDPFAKKP